MMDATENKQTNLVLPINGDLPKAVEDAISEWCENSEIKDKILFRYIFAINETLDAMIQLSSLLKIDDKVEIEIEPYQKHITTHITFPKEIPLDPNFDHKDDLLAQFPELKIQPDIFWHHVILKWVDKATWKKASMKKVTVSLTQYARAEDKQAGELYFLNMQPRPSKDLRMEFIEDDVVVARGSGEESAVKLTGKSIYVLQAIDGKTSVRDIYYGFMEKYGFIHPKVLGQIIEDLNQRKLIEVSSERLDDKQESKFKIFMQKLFKFRYSIPNSDKFIESVNQKIGWFWSKPALIIYVFFLAISVFAFSGYYSDLHDMLKERFSSHRHFDIRMLVGYYIGTAIYITIHELSHAVSCKRFGGRVQEFGMLFFYSNICFLLIRQIPGCSRINGIASWSHLPDH